MESLKFRWMLRALLTILVPFLLIASASASNHTSSHNSTNSTNATSTGYPAHGGGLYLGSLLACYVCIFLFRLLVTV